MDVTQKIYGRLSTILQDVFEDDDLEAVPELSAADVDGWDSLANVRLFLAVEMAFGIRFSASEIGSIDHLGDLVGLIASKSAA